jgi:hypothetical protein
MRRDKRRFLDSGDTFNIGGHFAKGHKPFTRIFNYLGIIDKD